MVLKFIKTVISGIFSKLEILATPCHSIMLDLWHMVCFSISLTTGRLSDIKPGSRRAVPLTDGVAQTPNAQYFPGQPPAPGK
jgi:hypothetical protein